MWVGHVHWRFKRQKFHVQCTTTTTVLLPLYTSTCVSRHLQLRTAGFVHHESIKTRHQTLGLNFTNYYPIFKIFFTSRLSSKFATNSCLNIPPRFKHVATLPCEIWMQKNGIILKYIIAIYNESQCSITKNLKVQWVTSLHIYRSLCRWKNF